MIDSALPNQREFKTICELVNTKLGMKFGEDKYPLITSRLGKRLRDLGLQSYRPYLELVMRDKDEETVMINLLTTNVTQFFREPWQFRYLQETLVPAIIQNNRNKTIRCWSAGCATGEEAYTLGMILLDTLPSDWNVKILASDISTSSLSYGSQGIYTNEQIRNIPDTYLRKYFTAADPGTFRVTDNLRQTVFFRRVNLNEIAALPQNIVVDFIFCRNVFIYFTKETQARAIDLFYAHLSPRGHLFLGHSESIDCLRDPRWESLKSCVYRRR
jgi:chemotaxis protein methyltransferase CheR